MFLNQWKRVIMIQKNYHHFIPSTIDFSDLRSASEKVHFSTKFKLCTILKNKIPKPKASEFIVSIYDALPCVRIVMEIDKWKKDIEVKGLHLSLLPHSLHQRELEYICYKVQKILPSVYSRYQIFHEDIDVIYKKVAFGK